jgi:hypothetical protein
MRDLDEVVASMTTEQHRVRLAATNSIYLKYRRKAIFFIIVLVLELAALLVLVAMARYEGVSLRIVATAVAIVLTMIPTLKFKQIADITWKAITDDRDELKAAWKRRQEMYG